MSKVKSPPSLITLILLTAFSTLTLNMFLPSLANIALDLDADYGLVSLAVALYLAVTAVMQLIVGPLSDRWGRRPVLLGAIVLFAFASVMCALAQDVWTFLFFRMLQGGMIAGYALSLAIVRDTHDESQSAGLIGYISMAMAIAPMLGPMLGGVLDTTFGWRANFWFYAISGVVLFILCWVDLGETHVAGKSAAGQAKKEFLELVSAKRFWAFALCAAFSTSAFYVFLAGAPLVAANEFSVSTAMLGVFIGSITVGFIVGSYVAARLASSVRLTTMMIAGRLITCGGLLIGLVLLTLGLLSPITYFGSTIFVGLGNGITLPSSSAGALSVRPKLAGTAAGLNGAATVAMGAVLTTLSGFLLSEEGGAFMLLLLMLLTSLAGLGCALWAQRLPQPAQKEG